jgi:hypothetical protein
VMLYDDMPARHMAALEKSVRALWQVPAAYLLLGSSLSAAYLANSSGWGECASRKLV